MSEETKIENLDSAAVRDRTRQAVRNAYSADNPVLIEAPPGSGKTTTALELVGSADVPVTYLSGRTDLYEEAEKTTGQEANVKVIPSPHRNCPTFNGENEGQKNKAEQLYNKGFSGKQIHYHSDVYTPCHSDNSQNQTCEYMRRFDEIKQQVQNGNVGLLIGNHKHAHNNLYIQNRIVILDEFNPDPFLKSLPTEGRIDDSDHPGNIISHFLDEIKESETEFPTETFKDVTDILLNRNEQESLKTALEWFEENGVTRSDVDQFEFYEISSYKHNQGHRLAPLLTLAFLCMREVGEGIELAPPPQAHDLPDIHDAWENSGLKRNERCVRDRNTGEVHLLQPPNLGSAKQIIGLDALPSKQMWDLLFAPDSGFEHRQIVSRENFSQYISSALNMTVKQIGDGKYPYAGGRISNKNKYRFAVIKALEENEFALISTQKAIEEYKSRKLPSWSVKTLPNESDDEDKELEFAMKNYATVLSSNDFEKENLGVVAGSPFPGYDVMRIWAGLCGEEFAGLEKEEPSSEIVQDLYEYFVQHQIIQAILRFGRHRDVWDSGGSTVYITTTDIPDWFKLGEQLTVKKETKATQLIKYLIEAKHSEGRRPFAE